MILPLMALAASAAELGQLPVFDVAPGARKSQPPPEKGGPLRFAVSRPLSLDLVAAARWSTGADGGEQGQLRIRSATATSLSLELSEAWLPPGARIWLEAADGTDARRRPVTRAAGGPLWTPLVRSDELVLTIELPPAAPRPRLQLAAVKTGVVELGAPPPQGSCNVDVVCEESEGWEAEIASVAVYAIGGELWCTGFLLHSTAGDEDPLFATAAHCGVSSRDAGSMVVYWNHQSPSCGRLSGGHYDDWQAGAELLMADSSSDWSLLRLDEAPDPDFEVAWAGWDRSGAAPTAATAIHHPGTDEKAISFEHDPTRITRDYEDREDLSGSHIRVDDWDLGTTEGGSSGSPLFDQNHRVAGILTGGYAACGNDEPDWYGRLSVAWDGSSASRRLQDWLDPGGTDDLTVDTWAPWQEGLDASGGLAARGPEGGPFSPETATVVLRNHDPVDHELRLSTGADWVEVEPAVLTLAADRDTTVELRLTASAAALPAGRHETGLRIESPDAAELPALPLSLLVGTPTVVYAEPLDDDPGWDTEGDWAFGVPEGRGGSNGHPDPTAGATGENVYGYNLRGDYDDRERARHLTTPPFDLRGQVGTELRFARWLGVEEPAYDNADVQVSVDGGESWTVVWSNPEELDDGAWTEQSIDLSALADDQPEVMLRWTMGATDESEVWCGWNIDDIEILGITPAEPVAPEPDPELDDSGTSLVDDPTPDAGADSDATPTATDDTGKATACGCGGGALPAMLGGLPLLLLAVRRHTRDPGAST